MRRRQQKLTFLILLSQRIFNQQGLVVLGKTKNVTLCILLTVHFLLQKIELFFQLCRSDASLVLKQDENLSNIFEIRVFYLEGEASSKTAMRRRYSVLFLACPTEALL